MSEPNPRPAVATAPISVILFAQALSTDTADALRAWQTYLESLKRPFEIFLIQENRPDVASDGTPAPSPVPTYVYERDKGYRDAFNAAVAAAQYPLLAFCTCDKQYQPTDLERMLSVIDKVDLVVGYRTVGQAPPWRVMLDLFDVIFCRIILGIALEPRRCWLGSAGLGRRWIARWVFGVRVLDPGCPFRLARREIFKNWPIQSGGPFLQIEMLAKANHVTCLLAEEGVSWTPPTMPSSDAISFGQDAWQVFRSPEFGAAPAPASATPG